MPISGNNGPSDLQTIESFVARITRRTYMELARPSTEYQDSYIKAIEEMRGEDRLIRLDFDLAEKDFAAFVKDLNERSEGKGLPPGYVSETIYWLVDGGEYIGRISIRHSLTEHLREVGGHIGYDIRPSKRKFGYGTKILELVLPKARDLGLDRVLLTCDETNTASRKIIESNGGVLEDKRPNPEGGSDKLRFWISLASP